GLELKLQKYEETAIVGNVMKDQLSKLSEIERENKKLKEENEYFRESKENYALLQERCNSLETKLSRSDSRIIQTTKLQIENEELQEKLKRWETMDAGGTIKARSPQELTRQVAELQQKEALLLAQQGQASTSAHSFEQAYKSIEIKDVTEEGGAARLAAAKLKLEVAQLKQQLEIVAVNTTISAVNPTEYKELKDRLAQMEKENLSLAERNETLEAIFEQRDMQFP
uniref:Mitotic spindle assembly checkpoint protein MAD1-like n=1 Tax=Saccoglossus kowalevskii TaxID=10224 RepID=A0ABM0MW59_SACKO